MIREATITDLPDVFRLGLSFEPYLHIGLDGRRFVTYWAEQIHLGRAAVFLRFEDDKLVGCIGGYVQNSPMDDVAELCEAFWYVSEDSRGGESLLPAYEQWGREQGAQRVFLTRRFGFRDRAMDRMYRRLGYEEVDVVYLKEVS